MISATFVEYWLKRYDQAKYPIPFFDFHLARLMPGMAADQFSETLIALLHWKDGKASLYSLDKYTAKPSIISPIRSLTSQSAADLAIKFFEFRVQSMLPDKGRSFFQHLQGLWQTVVIPVFVMHLARPLDVPIVDQHVVRAMRFLCGNFSDTQKTKLTWMDYEAYFDFFASVANESDLNRRQIDMALWAWGKELKQVVDSSHEEEYLTENEDSVEPPQFNESLSKPESVASSHFDEATVTSAFDHPFLWGQRLSTKVVPSSCNVRAALQRLLDYRNGGPDIESWDKVNLHQLGAYDWPDAVVSEILNVPGGSAAKNVLLEYKSRFGRDHDQDEIPRCIRNAFLIGTFTRSVAGNSSRGQFISWARERGFGGTNNAAGAIYQVGTTAGKLFGLLDDDMKPTALFREYFDI